MLRLCACDKLIQKEAENGEFIADSLRRHSESSEVKNAFTAFKVDECTNQKDFDERKKFFRLIQKTHLKRFCKRLCEEDHESASKRPVSAGVTIARTEDKALGDNIFRDHVFISRKVSTGGGSTETEMGGTIIGSEIGVCKSHIRSQ